MTIDLEFEKTGVEAGTTRSSAAPEVAEQEALRGKSSPVNVMDTPAPVDARRYQSANSELGRAWNMGNVNIANAGNSRYLEGKGLEPVPGAVIGAGNGWTDADVKELKSYLWGSVPFYYDNEIGTNDFLEKVVATQDPSFLAIARDDMNRALNMTDDEYVIAQMLESERFAAEGQPSGIRILKASLQAATVAHAEREHPLIAMGKLQRDTAAIETQFEAGQVAPKDLFSEVDSTIWSDDPDQAFREFMRSGESNDVTGRDGIYRVDGRNIIYTFEDDAGPMTSMVHLDEGTVINNEIQALAALVEAKLGERHKLYQDEVGQTRNPFGIVNRKVGDLIRYTENTIVEGALGKNPLAPDEDDLRADADKATRAQRESGTLTARIYAQIKDTEEMSGLGGEGVYAMAGQIAASPEYQGMTSDEIYDAAVSRAEEEGTWIPWMQETAIPSVVNKLEAYDKMVHYFGLTLMSIPDSIQNELDSDPLTTFNSAFEDAHENTYVSEFFGIEADSGWGQFVNLGASIAFDPITWLTPGGSASWSFMREMMTNPAMAAHLLKTPQYRSAVRQVVKGTGNKTIPLSLVNNGFPSKGALRIMDIAMEATPKGQWANRAAEIAGLFEDAIKHSDWIPAGPRQIVNTKSVLGLGAVIANSGKLSDTKLGELAGILARGSKDRGASVSQADFTTRALDAVATRAPNNPEKMSDLWRGALKAEASTQSGSADDIAMLTAALEDVKRQQRAIGRGVSDEMVSRVPEYREFLENLDPFLKDADDLGTVPRLDEMGRPGTELEGLPIPGGAEDALDIYEVQRRVRDYVELYGDEFDQMDELRATQKAEARRLKNEIDRLTNPQTSHAREKWWHEFYDEWADELGVPRLDDVEHPFLVDADGNPKMQHDWSKVTGERVAPLAHGDADTSWWAGYVGDVTTPKNKKVIDGMEEVGMQPQSSVTVMPASPIEMLTYKFSPNKRFAAAVRDARIGKVGVPGTLDKVQNVFAATVLLNLNTPVKTHGDEIIRFIQDAGLNSRSTVRASVPFSPTKLSTWGRAYERSGGSPSAARQRKWKLVDPARRGNWKAAERFFNGTLVKQDVVQRWARAVRSADGRRDWTIWWKTEGHQLYGKGARGQTMTADEAFEAVENGMNTLTRRMDESVKASKGGDAAKADELKNAVIEAASTGSPIKLEPKDWRRFPQVPGQDNTPNGLIDYSFDVLYGRPSDRRGGQIFEHYYEYHKATILERYERNGHKVIMDVNTDGEVDRLIMHGYAKNKSEALDILTAGRQNPKVQEMLRQGWKLESDIEAAAASYARGVADSMMYQMGTVSVLGKKLSRLYPWGRAQFDYIGYWAKKITEPSQFQVQAGTKGIGKVRTTPPVMLPTKAGRAGMGVDLNPLNRVNIRLLDRIAHIGTMGPQGVEGETDPYSPEWFVDTFTFLPSTLDEDFIIEQTPSPGPIASWSVEWLPPDHPLRETFDFIHPSHAVFNGDKINTISTALPNLVGAIAPVSGRSLRKITGEAVAWTMARTGMDPTQAYNMLVGLTEPPQFRDQVALRWGDYLDEVGFDPKGATLTQSGSTPWVELVDKIGEEATRAAYDKSAWGSIKKNMGAHSYMGESASYAKYWMPVDDYLDYYVEMGWVGEGQRDSFRLALGTVAEELEQDASAETYVDRRNRNAFVDTATDIIFQQIPAIERDKFLVDNLGAAVNFTSWVEVVEDKVPDEWAQFVSGGKIEADGETRREMYKQGRDEGWIVARDPEEYAYDIQVAALRAARSVTTNLFDELVKPLESSFATARSKKVLETKVYVTPEQWAEEWQPTIDKLYLDTTLPDEWLGADGAYRMTVGQVKDWIRVERSAFSTDTLIPKHLERVLNQSDNPQGRELWQSLKNADSAVLEEGLESPADLADIYPDQMAAINQMFQDQVSTNPDFTIGDYNRYFEYDYGPLGYEAPSPPALDLSGDEPPEQRPTPLGPSGTPQKGVEALFSGPKHRFSVIDGDTIEYTGSDGVGVPFRLVGINAPEEYQENGVEATAALEKLIAQADKVQLVMFERDRYGETQTFYSTEDGETVRRDRVFAWLYIDGQPIWFPEVFSPDNPRGAPNGVGGELPDYSQWLESEEI